MGNRFGWNGNRSSKHNRHSVTFANSMYNQDYGPNSQGMGPNQQRYFQFPPATNSMTDPTAPTGQPESFTLPTWNRRSRFIPVDTPNIPDGMGRKPL
jgi:hypothetical protein